MASRFANLKKNFKLKYYISYMIVSTALILFTVMQLTGSLKRSTADLLTEIAFSVILAVSLNLVVGFLGELSLGHAGFMCIGAYLGTLFMNVFSGFIPSKLICLIISMLLAGVCAAFFGFLVGLPALRLKGDYLAIVTLAFGEIVRNVFKNLPWFGKSLGYTSKGYGNTLFIVAFVAILIMLFVVQNLVRSKHGRAITAIRDNEIAARATGINVTYYKLIVFVIAAFFAGVAGVIYANYTTPILYSFFSYNYSIEILVMVVLGSMGSITGSILAASFLTYVNFYLKTNLTGDMAALKFLVYALILMVVVIFGNAPALRSFREKYNLKRLIFAPRKIDMVRLKGSTELIPINKRKIGRSMLFSVLTLGIYQIYWKYLLVKNTRALKQNSSKKCALEVLCFALIPFYSYYWWYTRGKVVREKLTEAGCPVAGTERVYLLLDIFCFGIVSLAIMQDDFNQLPSVEEKQSSNPATERNDEGSWDRIPTKIKMDELLSVDVKPTESVMDPDKGAK